MKKILFTVGAILASILFEMANHKLALWFVIPKDTGILSLWLVEESLFTVGFSVVAAVYYLACRGLNYIIPFKKAVKYILIPIFILFHIGELYNITNFLFGVSSVLKSGMWTLIYVFIVLSIQGFLCYGQISDIED